MTLIREAHVVIAGFSQKVGAPTGCQRLWMELGQLRAPETLVLLCEWNSPWAKVAETLFLCSKNIAETVIRVYAYSWGAGYGFVTLARELAYRGMIVQSAVLCDPVYRSRFLLLRWLAFCPWMKIHVPWNVREVSGLRECDTVLRGHEVVQDDPGMTTIHEFKRVRVGHVYIDDSPQFMEMCLESAGVKTCRSQS